MMRSSKRPRCTSCCARAVTASCSSWLSSGVISTPSTYFYVIQAPDGAGRAVHEANRPVDECPVNHAVVDQAEVFHVWSVCELPAEEVISAVVHGIDGGVVRRGVRGAIGTCGRLTILPGDACLRRSEDDARGLISFDARVADDRAFVLLDHTIEHVPGFIETALCTQSA